MYRQEGATVVPMLGELMALRMELGIDDRGVVGDI